MNSMTQTTNTGSTPEHHPTTAATTASAISRAAREALTWNIAYRPETASTFVERVERARHDLKAMEQRLAAIFPAHSSNQDATLPAGAAALVEVRETPRLLRTALAGMIDNEKSVALLPRVIHGEQNEEPRVAAISAHYLQAVDYHFTSATFDSFLQELQVHDPLTFDEVWSIPDFLKFAMLEAVLTRTNAILDIMGAAEAPSTPISLAGLRGIGLTDWVSLLEPHIVFDTTLAQDPAGTYSFMDFDSRQVYRRRIAFIARHSDHSEMEVAQSALGLARKAANLPMNNPRLRQRLVHIGYYLVDDGFSHLAQRVAFHSPWMHSLRSLLKSRADDFYITGIQFITILFVTAAIIPIVPHATVLASLAMLLLLIFPAMQNAVELVNTSVTAIFDPEPLPKLDFTKGIPSDFTTLVTVPTLLLNEKQVRELVTQLEVRFLANKDPQLHFALLTDLPDSVTKPHDKDFDPLVELAVYLIHELNERYKSQNQGSFLLLHRHRIFNRRQGVWMGWERKRGKLLDLNKLLANEYDAFPIKAGPVECLANVRYILTLDSDTQLPRGSAARMVGAIAHPLNQAVIDPKLQIVTAGYGILQPRIGVTVHSASRSRLASIYSGQTGFDIYARAVSDAYQDLYGEGSFTGKGIYEVSTLHTVLDHRFPRNSLLSHDLIEGAYARAGLTTDIELIDDYPSHLSAYNRRKHRWVRGDWQIVQWMFSRVPEESGRMAANPISAISRWKIFDNLRRSLVEPFTFLLFVIAWLNPPGGALYWTLIALGFLFFPVFVQFGFTLTRALFSDAKGVVPKAFSGFSQNLLITFLNFVFLPQQAMLSIDAIVRSLVRRYITGERLLEWETAAQSEAGGARRTPVDRYLTLTPLVAICVAALTYWFGRHSTSIFVATPILLIWLVAPLVTRWLNAPPSERNQRLSDEDEDFLKLNALLIWRYFHQFSSARHHYLIPDNVEENHLFEAARVSPTNVGLLLNVRQAACEFGFLTLPEFATLTTHSLNTIQSLKKHRGHLYNWYDTETLAALHPRMISSVDSGNFIASLYTLHSGALDLLRKPLLPRQLFTILDTFRQLPSLQQKRPSALRPTALPSATATISDWILWLNSNRAALTAAVASPEEDPWWITEMETRIDAVFILLRDFMPWLLPEYAPLLALPQLASALTTHTFDIEKAAAFSQMLALDLRQACATLETGTTLRTLGEQLTALLPEATQKLNTLAGSLRTISQAAEQLAEQTEFDFLVDPSRKLLSIGFDAETGILHDACYDLLASEARIATFLAIARGEMPQSSWFKMGREHVSAFGEHVLISWTGTMFEYLMPSLWMRSYPDTLIARTLAASVRVQIAFTRALKLAWGISESGYALQDDGGHYQYKAFGVPEVALKFDADPGPVIAPYASFLALSVDAMQSLRNLRRMTAAQWSGTYGLYEAVDYSSQQREPILVREWMAHHQGMSLLAILNLLQGNVVQQWFHANPVVQSAELLLHEMPASKAALSATI